MSAFDKYVGQVFDHRYKIVKIIGVGGMAVVFEAVDLVMKCNVAVKMLKDEINNDIQSVKRFNSESRAISMLSHPNIVSIYDVSFKANLKYIVMEYVNGITLKAYMNRKGALSFRETISFAEQTLRALEHAHSKNIIHRDIKPQNIILLKDGRIKVTDFGIAKLPNAETVTMTDKAIGTVYYISPEQASGKRIDQRSDLYSLGVMMYEMATGQLPFMADSPVSVALMQVSATPRRPRDINPSIPIGLEQIIMGAMEKDPEKRFRTASQMLRHIAQLKANPTYVFRSSRPNTNQQQTRAPQKYRSNYASGTKKKHPKPMPGRKKKSSRSMFPIISGVTTAFLIVIVATAITVFGNLMSDFASSSPKSITIPDYVNELYTPEFRQDLNSLKYYNITIVDKFTDEYPENTIIDQEPEAGENRKVAAGKQYCDLVLTVTRGEKEIILPDFTITEYRLAETQLRDKYSLIPTTESEYNDFVPLGYVIRTEPEAGASLKSGDVVKLIYSKGQKIDYVTVPSFIGMTEEKAYATLIAKSLSLDNVIYEYTETDKYPEYVPAGQVIWQSKTANSEVPANSTKISFIVSLGSFNKTTPETDSSSTSNSSGSGFIWSDYFIH
ncbi:MAG: Stk1 family PASTA domain-containing Ser/Thr kinase [Clostridia bacterium]|nr:Stk1 family PASTA domain-containing Ser/Thr kinase [Clostridia bacterium]